MNPVLSQLARAVAAALEDPVFAAAVQHHRGGDPVAMLSTPLLNADAVAALLDISEKTVRQYAREERLPSRRIGRHLRFVLAEVERAALDGRLAA